MTLGLRANAVGDISSHTLGSSGLHVRQNVNLVNV